MMRIVHSINYLFMKIAEPRVTRLLQFGIYICMMIAGYGVIVHPPTTFESLVGTNLVFIFGMFIALGSLMGAVAVLPGIWWLERVGIISLVTAMAMYSVFVISLGASLIGIAVPVAFALSFVQRWQEIRKYQLAPRED